MTRKTKKYTTVTINGREVTDQAEIDKILEKYGEDWEERVFGSLDRGMKKLDESFAKMDESFSKLDDIKLPDIKFPSIRTIKRKVRKPDMKPLKTPSMNMSIRKRKRTNWGMRFVLVVMLTILIGLGIVFGLLMIGDDSPKAPTHIEKTEKKGNSL